MTGNPEYLWSSCSHELMNTTLLKMNTTMNALTLVIIFSVGVMCSFACYNVEAKRGPNPQVEDVCIGEYIVSKDTRRAGVILVENEVTSKKFSVELYRIEYNQFIERDVQIIEINSISVERDILLISDEANREYRLTLEDLRRNEEQE